jgi:hypothetical protein
MMIALLFFVSVFSTRALGQTNVTECRAEFEVLLRQVNVTLPLASAITDVWLSVVAVYLADFPNQEQPWSVWFEGYKDHMLQMLIVSTTQQLFSKLLVGLTSSSVNQASQIVTSGVCSRPQVSIFHSLFSRCILIAVLQVCLAHCSLRDPRPGVLQRSRCSRNCVFQAVSFPGWSSGLQFNPRRWRLNGENVRVGRRTSSDELICMN